MQAEDVHTFTESVRSCRSLDRSVLLVVVILFCLMSSATAQTENDKELWPSVKVNLDLHKKIGLQIYSEKENGEELPKAELNAGATLSYRIKPLFGLFHSDIVSENEYLVTMSAGYEFLRKSKNGQPSNENRLIIDFTPRYSPGAGFMFLNRNQLEFRWVDGKYDFRYRVKMTAQRTFKTNRFTFTPYASGELFHDRNHHSWNENQYAFGIQLPYRQRLMLDTYLLHQNCTTCSQQSLNVLGITLNLYFKRKK